MNFLLTHLLQGITAIYAFLIVCMGTLYKMQSTLLNYLKWLKSAVGFIDQEKDASPVWWLEGSSYPIQILDKKVKVLVRSDELKRRYKHDPVIVSFEYGEGIVYHMISHFYLQRSETRTQKQGKCRTTIAVLWLLSRLLNVLLLVK